MEADPHFGLVTGHCALRCGSIENVLSFISSCPWVSYVDARDRDANRIEKHLHKPLRRRPTAKHNKIALVLYAHVGDETAQQLDLAGISFAADARSV